MKIMIELPDDVVTFQYTYFYRMGDGGLSCQSETLMNIDLKDLAIEEKKQ